MTIELTPRLKNDNWDLHQIAERSATPASMIKGTISREEFASSLAQTALVFRALDEAVTQLSAARSDLGVLIHDEQSFGPYLDEDLAFFEVDPATISATPGTQRYIDTINEHADDPCYIFGLHYVRLGACNGNRFVARKLRSVFGLTDNEGTRFLDPFGESQRQKWNAFKEGIDTLDLTQDEQDRVFAGTRAAYVLTINMDYDEALTADQLLAKFSKTLDKDAFEQKHSVHVAPGESA